MRHRFLQPGLNCERNSGIRWGTAALKRLTHLQRRLVEERDELSREQNHHLLSQELCGRQRGSEGEAGNVR